MSIRQRGLGSSQSGSSSPGVRRSDSTGRAARRSNSNGPTARQPSQPRQLRSSRHPGERRPSSSPRSAGLSADRPTKGSLALQADATRNETSSKSPESSPAALPASADMGDGRHLVFTYGTLMSGFHNNHFMDGAESRGCATTVESYRMFVRNPKTEYHVSIPFAAAHGEGAVLDAPEVPIRGEVYAVTGEQLSDMDGLEQHPTWYHREVVAVRLGDAIVPCWLYFNEVDMLNVERLAIVPSGDFRNHTDAPPPPPCET
eukprot:TRINITY_DN73775_c0_g1_i1.p1 TRINITY_DN73775_c0_g1~~TRINITY_DN73775_c0_g1_i1.p1  ORF type:complete len:259 (-),score=26.75 TRINITY_DN73775_c0_g1_i1:175-951(-)